jgi:tRNA-dihydrouridine synthase 4
LFSPSSQCDGIDINCGCPQPWAISEGYGCGMLGKPELIKEMVISAREMSNLPCSIKIRVAKDLRYLQILLLVTLQRNC